MDTYPIQIDRPYRRLFAKDYERILVHVSNFRKVKKVKDVIEVFCQVSKKVPSKLIMIGDGPERHAVEEKCRKLGVCDDVKFVGKSKVVEKCYPFLICLCLPPKRRVLG